MSILNIVSLFGGLALFLYGISIMGDGLNMVAGNRLQKVLYRLTSNPVKGLLLGIGVTALIQSSTATSVMAIGFVNSGLAVLSGVPRKVRVRVGYLVCFIITLYFIGEG